MSLTDYQIQKKIRDGDIREFERLFHKYYEPLCSYAFRITGDMAAAEDILQEFFYNFWRDRVAMSLKLSLKAYFYRSIRNNAYRLVESRQVRAQYAERMARELPAGEAFYIPMESPDVDLNARIDEILEQMPERTATVFRLSRFEGKKYREIAELLSLSVKTVEAEMGKALGMFREALKEYRNTES